MVVINRITLGAASIRASAFGMDHKVCTEHQEALIPTVMHSPKQAAALARCVLRRRGCARQWSRLPRCAAQSR